MSVNRITSPAKLLAVFSVLSGIPLLALSWLGGRVLQQDRALEVQRSRDRLENAATVMLGEMERQLAGWDDLAEQAAYGTRIDPPPGVVLLIFDGDGILEQRGIRLPYQPRVRSDTGASAEPFVVAEMQEFRDGNLPQAAHSYINLATSSSSRVRAAALVRLARVRRKQQELRLALDVYSELAAMGEVSVAGSPAELVARRERVVLLKLIGDHAAAAREASLLGAALTEGRFAVDRPTFEFYREAAADLDGFSSSELRLRLAEAAHAFWRLLQDRPAGRAGWTGDGAFVAVWQRAGARSAAVIGDLETLITRVRLHVDPASTRMAVKDATGRQVWGTLPAADVVVEKMLSESDLPWTLQVAVADPFAAETTLKSRRNLFAASLGLMIVVIGAAGYFVFTAVNKELRVARLQSDFVAAVSHEFRTPLTAICHLTELLEDGQTSASRIAEFHRALSKESRRLHAMVEGLLDFGRIDSGRRTYELAEVDAISFVGETVRDFREQQAVDGRRVEFAPARETKAAPLVIRVDRGALRLALRNLLDNAVKYSPPSSSVTVSVRSAGHFVGISVDDEGPGVLKEEAKEIFRKFARGAAARSTNVKGTGIGLTMAAEIVRAHGGRLELASKPGPGSRFVTLLPLQNTHA